MASFTVKVRILGEAATSQAVNRALRDLNKLERQAARINKKARGRVGRGSGRRGFQQAGVPTGGRGFSSETFHGRGIAPLAPVAGPTGRGRGRRRGGGAGPPPISGSFGGVDKAERGFRNINRAAVLGGLSSSLGRISRQGSRAFFAPINKAREFQDVMKNVEAKTNASTEAMEALRTQARTLGRSQRFQFGAVEVGTAQDFLAQAGFTPDQILGAVEATLDLAKAGGESVGFASDFLSDVVTPFKVLDKDSSVEEVSKQMRRFGDALIFTANSANVNLRQLRGALANVAGSSAGAGLSIEETTAILAQMGSAMVKNGRAGTALRNILSRLSAPKSAGRKALKALGIDKDDIEDANGNLRKIPAILKTVGDALDEKLGKGKGGRKRTAVIEALVGLRSVEAGRELISGAQSGQLQERIRLAETAGAGESGRVAKLKADTTSGRLAAANAALESLQIEIGESFTPTLLSLLKTMQPVVQGIAEFTAANPKLVQTLAPLLIGLTALSGAMSAVAAGATVLFAAKGGFAQLFTGVARTGTAAVAAGPKMAAFNNGLGVVGAAFAGFTFGTIVDQIFGISDAISDFAAGSEGDSARKRFKGEIFLSPEKTKKLAGLEEKRLDFREELDAPSIFKSEAARKRDEKDLTAIETEIAEIRAAAGQLADARVKVEVEIKNDGSVSARATDSSGTETTVDTGRQTQGL